MKWVRAGMLLCMLIFLVSYAAENNTETAPKQDAKQASSSEAAAEVEYEEGNMRREFCTVERRCAMTNTVRPCIRLSIPF